MDEENRYLIVNADDFGYCPRRNEGIVRCIRDNVVSSVSVLVNATATEQVCKLKSFTEDDSLSVGLHFNISEGCALSSVSSVPSLLDKDYHFLGKFSLHQASINGQIVKEEVERELRAQIHHFKVLMNHPPSHIDGHQHVHVFPGIREAFAKVLREENITWTRMPIDNQVEKCYWINDNQKQFYKQVILMAKQSIEIFKNHNIKFIKKFVGMTCMGKYMTVQRLEDAILDDSEESKFCEIMVHPGYAAIPEMGGCGQGPDDFALSLDREYEMDILCSREWKDLMKSINAKLVSFQEVAQIKDNS